VAVREPPLPTPRPRPWRAPIGPGFTGTFWGWSSRPTSGLPVFFGEMEFTRAVADLGAGSDHLDQDGPTEEFATILGIKSTAELGRARPATAPTPEDLLAASARTEPPRG
jgi:hypothetical protein